ncbi:MAG: hypothetical protein ACREV1_10505 [Gammaproteobacteria bacterium]
MGSLPIPRNQSKAGIGLNEAKRRADCAVKGGVRAVVIETELVGGECPCMPGKSLLRPLQALAAAQAVAGSCEAFGGSARHCKHPEELVALTLQFDQYLSPDPTSEFTIGWLRDER